MTKKRFYDLTASSDHAKAVAMRKRRGKVIHGEGEAPKSRHDRPKRRADGGNVQPDTQWGANWGANKGTPLPISNYSANSMSPNVISGKTNPDAPFSVDGDGKSQKNRGGKVRKKGE